MVSQVFLCIFLKESFGIFLFYYFRNVVQFTNSSSQFCNSIELLQMYNSRVNVSYCRLFRNRFLGTQHLTYRSQLTFFGQPILCTALSRFMISAGSRRVIVKDNGLRRIAHLLHQKAKILHFANELYAVEKPIDILSHPNRPDDIQRSVVRGTYNTKEERFEIDDPTNSTGKEAVYLINRLDSATSGIILMTTNEKLSHIVKKLFAERKVSKVYKAVVFCTKKIEKHEKVLLWEDFMQIQKVNGSNRAQQCKSTTPLAQNAVTEITVTDPNLFSLGRSRKEMKDMMILELRPKTGFTHQLRYQCALHEMPIVGDRTYGNFKQNRAIDTSAKSFLNTLVSKDEIVINSSNISGETNKNNVEIISTKRMLLHSYSIEFKYEMDNIAHTFKAVSKLPPEFKIILDNSYDKL